jgi:hypothetical protein
MKKNFISILLPIALLCGMVIKPANALLSGYFGITAGAVNGKATSEYLGEKSSTKNASGGTTGAILGLEANLLLIKFGVEGFVDKSMGFQANGYKNPLFYGAKGKILFNFILVDPYITFGYGTEKNSDDYKNNFGLAGLGVQTKLLNFGAFVELNYLQSLSGYSDYKAKTSRTAIQAGLKYYFF